MEQVAVDTTFLIDLQNELRARGRSRGAGDFLRANPTAEFFLPAVARGEFLEGFDDPTSPTARVLVDAMKDLDVTREVALSYASVTRELRLKGHLIGANDLWIGATARAAGLPIVTRNAGEFRRIPGLTVLSYAAD